MEVKIMAFGKIADIVDRNEWKWEGVKNTEALRERLENDFPQLQGMRYLIAVNKKIATSETLLQDQAEIALLPPFSGG